MNVGIYLITSPTGKVYIGQSWQLQKREKSYSRGYCYHQPKIFASIKKHGWDSHTFEVLIYLRKDVKQSIMNYFECMFIDYYKDLGFNLMNIRGGGSNGKISKETIEKIRNKQKGVPRPYAKNNKTQLGKKLSKETKIKISNALKSSGRYDGANNPSAKVVYQYSKSGDFIRVWPCMMDAARFYNINKSRISRCCLGGRKSSGGFKWSYSPINQLNFNI